MSSTAVYEIVLLPGGDVVLQRVDDRGEQLVRISFSTHVKAYLGATSMGIAKAMIDAGIDAVERLGDSDSVDADEENFLNDDYRAGVHTLH